MTTSTLRLERDGVLWRDKMRLYKVILDGRSIGKIGFGKVAEFPIEPGSHRLRMGIDWAGSRTVEFEVGPNETSAWKCRPGGGAWTAVACILTPRRYVALEAVHGE
jgi:hypothetical protein